RRSARYGDRKVDLPRGGQARRGDDDGNEPGMRPLARKQQGYADCTRSDDAAHIELRAGRERAPSQLPASTDAWPQPGAEPTEMPPRRRSYHAFESVLPDHRRATRIGARRAPDNRVAAVAASPHDRVAPGAASPN